jgi:hypothetical protein
MFACACVCVCSQGMSADLWPTHKWDIFGHGLSEELHNQVGPQA